MGAEWICIFVFFLLIAGLIVFLVTRKKGPQAGFPVGPVGGPVRFRVRGVNRNTRQDVVWLCDADSPANAQVKAELEGIIVTSIEPDYGQPPR